jgi:hypothetical protein
VPVCPSLVAALVAAGERYLRRGDVWEIAAEGEGLEQTVKGRVTQRKESRAQQNSDHLLRACSPFTSLRDWQQHRACRPPNLAASDCRAQPQALSLLQGRAASVRGWVRVCELNLHSTARRTPISADTAVQGPASCCGAGVRRAFRGGATTEVASAAISVINQRALQVAPTTNRDRPRAPA